MRRAKMNDPGELGDYEYHQRVVTDDRTDGEGDHDGGRRAGEEMEREVKTALRTKRQKRELPDRMTTKHMASTRRRSRGWNLQ